MTQPDTETLPPVDRDAQQRLADLGVDAENGNFAHLALDAITVEHNPRSSADVDGLDALAHSIRTHGILQPILVAPAEDGRYVLVAGQRRLEACRLAGQPSIPAYIRTDDDGAGSRLVKQLIENGAGDSAARRAMDPVDEAYAIAELMRSYGLDEGGVAGLLSSSRQTVGRRLELLALPDDVQEHARHGAITLANARTLAGIARKTAPLASAIAARVVDGSQGAKDLDEDPAAAVTAVADASTPPADVFVLPFSGGVDVVNLTDVAARIQAALETIARDTERAHAAEQLGELRRHLATVTGDAVIEIATADTDRARAAHSLVEFRRDRLSSTAFLIDAALAADWALTQAQRVATGTQPARSAQAAPTGDGDDDGEDREERKTALLAAKATNAELGAAIRGFDAQGDVPLEQATVLVALLVDRFGPELATGLRLTRPEFQSRQVKVLKSGETRTREHMVDADEAGDRLHALLDRAQTGPELIGRAFGALAAAVFADQDALPPTQRRPLVAPYTQGREHTVIGRAPSALWQVMASRLPERIHATRKAQFAPDAGTRQIRDRLARRR